MMGAIILRCDLMSWSIAFARTHVIVGQDHSHHHVMKVWHVFRVQRASFDPKTVRLSIRSDEHEWVVRRCRNRVPMRRNTITFVSVTPFDGEWPPNHRSTGKFRYAA